MYTHQAGVSGEVKTKGSKEQKLSVTQSQQAEQSGEGEWAGDSHGSLSFRKRPNGQGPLTPGKWTFSRDGMTRPPLKDHEVGDIHFSPVSAGASDCQYWVLFDNPKRRWVLCFAGQAHPLAEGYVLGPRDGRKPPRWIWAQSL
ncbi:hypothetical protein FS749_016081 [Ceratobasidium sp. UAMH 11750]|nr:hypothetical protein FS749_016081 [Ceratobasidium sp. UAMH 11750]